MADYFPVYIYGSLVLLVTLATMVGSGLFPSIRSSKVKFMPYESGMQTKTQLLQEKFKLRHYLVALMFLVFDVEVVFLYPWATVGKEIGSFAFYEMSFFLVASLVGFAYMWKKGGLEWE